MASINNLVSYELNGVKESFANWISNLSPTDTPFVSMTAKEAVKNKFFQWQEDQLGKFGANAVAEGSDAQGAALKATTVRQNVTQILRKTVQVSDTANSLSNYGRGREMQYQLEKAGKEIKRDLEWAFLNQKEAKDAVKPGVASGNALVRFTAGFEGLVAPLNAVSPEDNLAIVHQSGNLTEDNLFKVTQGLYLAGACPDIIMFHPKHAKFFSGLMETTSGTRIRMFDGASDSKINFHVSTLVDPLGCTYKLIPNRFMPADRIFFFWAGDWTQMVLRTPTTQLLAKTGSFDKYMIEMEVGLRHKNQFASGILDVIELNGDSAPTVSAPDNTGFPQVEIAGAPAAAHPGVRLYVTTGPKTQQITATKDTNAVGELQYTSSDDSIATVDANGLITAKAVGKARISVSTGGAVTIVNVYVYDDNTVKSVRFERTEDDFIPTNTLLENQTGVLIGGAIASTAAEQTNVKYVWSKGDDVASLTADATQTTEVFTLKDTDTTGKTTFVVRCEAQIGTDASTKITRTQEFTVTPAVSPAPPAPFASDVQSSDVEDTVVVEVAPVVVAKKVKAPKASA